MEVPRNLVQLDAMNRSQAPLRAKWGRALMAADMTEASLPGNGAV